MEKTLLDNNNIKIIETKVIPRYEGIAHYCQAACEMFVDDVKEQNKIWMTSRSREGFDSLNTGEAWEPEGESVYKDIESFQKYLDDTYGKDKYEAYAVGAYIHSGVSFSISKGPDNRCRWDSGTIGFVGIPKYSVEYWEKRGGISEYASLLTESWEGTLGEICVYDDYTGDLVDSCWTTDTCAEIEEWKAKMKEEYGVTEYEEENHY